MSYDVTDFQKEVLERSKTIPVLVDFWAEWCGPCKMLGPVLERLAARANGDWQLAKVDTEAMPDVAQAYNIRSIPNVKLFVDGKVATEFTGALPEPMVQQWLQKNIPSRHRKDVERAEQLLEENNAAKATPLLEHVIAAEPGNHQARVLLARTFLESDPAKAVDLVQSIEEDSEYFDIAEAIRTFASLLTKAALPDALPAGDVRDLYRTAARKLAARDFAGALEGFIDVIRTDRYYDDDGARKACIAIFKLLGEEHDITRRYRREFGSALNV